MGEVWKSVIDGKYEVSDLGRIRLFKTGRIRKTSPHHVDPKKSYLKFVVSSGRLNGKRSFSSYYVHRLVVEAFIGPIKNGLDVNHRDGDRFNNRLSNLEIVTRKQNMAHARSLGLVKYVLKLEDAIEIRILSKYSSMPQRAIAKIYGISNDYVSNIKLGKNWKHIAEAT